MAPRIGLSATVAARALDVEQEVSKQRHVPLAR